MRQLQEKQIFYNGRALRRKTKRQDIDSSKYYVVYCSVPHPCVLPNDSSLSNSEAVCKWFYPNVAATIRFVISTVRSRVRHKIFVLYKRFHTNCTIIRILATAHSSFVNRQITISWKGLRTNVTIRYIFVDVYVHI